MVGNWMEAAERVKKKERERKRRDDSDDGGGSSELRCGLAKGEDRGERDKEVGGGSHV